MRIYQALQREKDGRWVHTCTSGKFVYPVGRCAMGARDGHPDGHATQAEAERCFAEFELETVHVYETKDTQRKCVVCGVWTTTRAQVGSGMGCIYDACSEHANRGALAPHHLDPKKAGAL